VNVGDLVIVTDPDRAKYRQLGTITTLTGSIAFVAHDDDPGRYAYTLDDIAPADTIGARLAHPARGDDALADGVITTLPDDAVARVKRFIANRHHDTDGAA